MQKTTERREIKKAMKYSDEPRRDDLSVNMI